MRPSGGFDQVGFVALNLDCPPATNLLIVRKTPIEKAGQDRFKLGSRFENPYLVLQNPAREHLLGVPTDPLAELQNRETLLAEFADVEKWSRSNWHFCSIVGGSGMMPVVSRLQISRKIQGIESHARPIITPAHFVCSIMRRASCGTTNISIADDGNFVHGRDDLCDAVEAGFAGESHLRRAAVYCDERYPSIFEPGG